jgi:hypothetical protein
MWWCACWKYCKQRGTSIESPLLFVKNTSAHWPCVCSGVSPLLLLTHWRIGRVCICVSAPCIDWIEPVIEPSATECRYVKKRLSFCVVSGVTLWKPIGCYLCPSRNIKRIALRAKFEARKLYDVVCLLLRGTVRVFCNMLGCTSRMCPAATTRLMPIRWAAPDA